MKWLFSVVLAGLFFVAPCQARDTVNQDTSLQALEFLPLPPAENSPDFLRDKEIYQQTRALKGTERWNQATFDADLKKNGGAFFKDAVGMTFSKEKTPATYELLTLASTQAGKAEKSAKAQYMRKRPYMYFEATGSTCAPGDEEELRHNGSYPSGHSSRGWAMALVLSELFPERQNAIMKRGYEFGQSRVICGFHWQSDVDAGRVVGAASVAQLHTKPDFVKLLEKAKLEIKQLQQ